MPKKTLTLTIVGGRETSPDLPDLADVYSMAYKTLSELPEKFQPYLSNLLIRVENFAETETLAQLNIKDKYDLLGLYKGTPLPQKSPTSSAFIPDVIFLYRCPLIRFSRESRETVLQLVQHVMYHEMGHHFGYNDYDIEWIKKT